MAKRYVKKKKKRVRRLARLLGLLVLLTVVVLVLVLAMRPSPETSVPAAKAGDDSWYRDDIGRIEEDKPLVKGMAAFEKKTGARPFLTLLAGVDPEELDLFVQDQYDALFTDGGHVLVVYDEWEEGTYYLAARTGAESALTGEDVSRLLTAIEKAYADPANENYADAFGTGFSQGAKAVSAREGQSSTGITVLLVLGIILLILSVVLVIFLQQRRRVFALWAREDQD